MGALIDSASKGVPFGLREMITLGRALTRCAADIRRNQRVAQA
ncbi:hypothetical protein [Mycolicibacterium rhodesiae]|nr:hypothetical protein [Mycolicibacterium rhodesiae]